MGKRLSGYNSMSKLTKANYQIKDNPVSTLAKVEQQFYSNRAANAKKIQFDSLETREKNRELRKLREREKSSKSRERMSSAAQVKNKMKKIIRNRENSRHSKRSIHVPEIDKDYFIKKVKEHRQRRFIHGKSGFQVDDFLAYPENGNISSNMSNTSPKKKSFAISSKAKLKKMSSNFNKTDKKNQIISRHQFKRKSKKISLFDIHNLTLDELKNVSGISQTPQGLKNMPTRGQISQYNFMKKAQKYHAQNKNTHQQASEKVNISSMIHKRNKSLETQTQNTQNDSRLSQLNMLQKNQNLMSNYKSRLMRQKLQGRANKLKSDSQQKNQNKTIENLNSLSNQRSSVLRRDETAPGVLTGLREGVLKSNSTPKNFRNDRFSSPSNGQIQKIKFPESRLQRLQRLRSTKSIGSRGVRQKKNMRSPSNRHEVNQSIEDKHEQLKISTTINFSNFASSSPKGRHLTTFNSLRNQLTQVGLRKALENQKSRLQTEQLSQNYPSKIRTRNSETSGNSRKSTQKPVLKIKSRHAKKRSEPIQVYKLKKILNKNDKSQSRLSHASISKSKSLSKSRHQVKVLDVINRKAEFRKNRVKHSVKSMSKKSQSLLNKSKNAQKKHELKVVTISKDLLIEPPKFAAKSKNLDLATLRSIKVHSSTSKKMKNTRILWDSHLKLRVQDELYFGECVGQGSFARVYEAHDKILKVPVAVKVIDKRKLKDDRRKMLVQREVHILSSMNSEHISEFYRLIEDRKRVYFVMELCGSNTLSRLAKRRPRNRFGETEARTLFKQVVEGVLHIHVNGFCHRDLKMTNILVDNKGKTKIVDFGFASETKTLQKMYCGTPSYMAPEIVLKKVYDGKAVDIWSLGVVLYKMFTGKYVFGCKNKFLFFVFGTTCSNFNS